MTSSRLPGKVLADIDGRPLLVHMVERLRRARGLDTLILATTINRSDDRIIAVCDELGIASYRGDEFDVLGRFVGAANATCAGTIVRLTADCPMIDPALIDEALNLFQKEEFDYLSNALTRTFPDGLDLEVFTREALNEANESSDVPFQREHVTPYLRTGFYQNVPTGAFRIGELQAPADFAHLRWTVDTASDLKRVRAMVQDLPTDYGWLDVVALQTRRPDLLTEPFELDIPAVRLRRALSNDRDLPLKWINSHRGETRVGARDGHSSDSWSAIGLLDLLNNGNCLAWVAELNGEVVGQIWLELRNSVLDVDIYVLPSARRNGVGLEILRLAQACAARKWAGVPLAARIDPEDWNARRLFARAGFGSMVFEDDHVRLMSNPENVSVIG